MKRKILLITVILLSFIACNKDLSIPSATFQIVNNIGKSYCAFEPLLNGSLYEVIVFGYNEKEELIKHFNIDKVETGGGKSEVIEVPHDVVKVKVSFMMIPPESIYFGMDSNVRLYVKAYSYLTATGNTLIAIDGNMMAGTTISSIYNAIEIDFWEFKELILNR
jgi:hypothetical protein